MFKKFPYLASVSIIASMAMSQPGYAMDGEPPLSRPVKSKRPQEPFPPTKPVKATTKKQEDPVLLWNNSTANDVSSVFYYDSEGEFGRVDPRQSMAKGFLADFGMNWATTTARKVSRLHGICSQVYSGNYDELASEAFDFFFAGIAGEPIKNFFRNSDKELDTRVVVRAAKVVVDKFLKQLSKNGDLYGELPDGTKIPIYNANVLRNILEQWLPNIPIAKRVAIKFLDIEAVKNTIESKLIEIVVELFKRYFEAQGVTLKEALGQGTTTLGAKIANAVSSKSDANPQESPESLPKPAVDSSLFWEYIGPHLNHHLRHHMLSLLEKSKNTFFQKLEDDVWRSTFQPCASGLSAGIFGIGSVVTYLGYNDLFVRGAGMAIGACGPLGYTGATALWTTIKDHASKYIDNKSRLLAYNQIPYSREEHALYQLNPNPTELERGLAFEDYALRDTLNSEGYLKKIAEIIFQGSSIESLMTRMFGKNEPPKSLIKYCMYEEQTQAYRLFTLLQERDPDEAQKVAKNLRKYPSYEQKIKFLQHLQATSVNDIEREEADAQEYVKSTQKIVQKIHDVAGQLADELCAQNNHFLPFKESLVEIFTQGILSSSIETQDHAIKWAEEHQAQLKEFVKAVAKKSDVFFIAEGQMNEDGFFEIPDEKQVSAEKTLNAAKAEEFIKMLMKTCVKGYIEQEKKRYLSKHQDSIKYLLSKPMTEGMDATQVAYRLWPLQDADAERRGPLGMPPEIVHKAFSIFTNDELLKLSMVSRTWHKLCLDIIDERKALTFFPKLGELSPEDGKYFAKHRPSILLMEAEYRKLMREHLGFTFFETLEDHLKQKKVRKKIKAEIQDDIVKKQLCTEGEKTAYTFEDITETVLQLLMKNDDYQYANNIIKSKEKEMAEAYNIYKALRYNFAEDIARKILQDLQANKKRKTFRELPASSQSTGGWGVNNFWGNSSASMLTQETFDQDVNEAAQNLEHHDYSPKGVRGEKFLEVIKKDKPTNNGNVCLRDLINYHKNISKDQLTKASANASVINYMTQYAEWLDWYQYSTPLFRGKLFFGLEEFVEANRAYDKKDVKSIVSPVKGKE